MKLSLFVFCRKIELIQSKVGISLTAVITILGSLFMSLGLTGLTVLSSHKLVAQILQKMLARFSLKK